MRNHRDALESKFARRWGTAFKVVLPAAALVLVLAGPAAATSKVDDKADEAGAKAHDYKAEFQRAMPLAKKGHAQSQFRVGILYYTGQGVEQDYKEAARWLKLAAAQGNGDAQYYLGSMYQFGRGVPKDLELAYTWYLISLDRLPVGLHELLLEFFDKIAEKLTPEQIERAKKKKEEWKPSPL